MGSPQVVGLGWLQGTTRDADRSALLVRLGSIFGAVKGRDGGTQWYCESATVGRLGVTVAWTPRTTASKPSEVLVSIPQGALDALGFEGARALLGEMLGTWGVRPSRLDAYVDDIARSVDPSTVREALDAGQVRTHIRAWRSLSGSDGGMTVYIGSKDSDATIRVYRKWIEAKDDSLGVRWELQVRSAHAQLAASALASAPDSAAFALVLWGLIRNLVDFVDVDPYGGRPERSPLTGWWSALVGAASRARPAVAKCKDTLQRRRDWFARQVEPTLAVLFAVDGSAGLNEAIRRGWARAPWDVLAPPPAWVPVESES